MKETRDLWLAAYFIENGFGLEKFEIISQGRAKYYFNMTDEKYSELKLSFFQSDIGKIKHTMKELKDFAY